MYLVYQNLLQQATNLRAGEPASALFRFDLGILATPPTSGSSPTVGHADVVGRNCIERAAALPGDSVVRVREVSVRVMSLCL